MTDGRAAEQADRQVWGPHDDRTLFDLAREVAERVYDYGFRIERRRLVEQYTTWATGPTPDADTAHRVLATLVPLALFDATLLDALLARLVALDLADLGDDDWR